MGEGNGGEKVRGREKGKREVQQRIKERKCESEKKRREYMYNR